MEAVGRPHQCTLPLAPLGVGWEVVVATLWHQRRAEVVMTPGQTRALTMTVLVIETMAVRTRVGARPGHLRPLRRGQLDETPPPASPTDLKPTPHQLRTRARL